MTSILVYSSLYKRPYIGLISHFFCFGRSKVHPLGYKITYLPPVSSLYLPSGANISPRALRALGEILAPSGEIK